MHYRTRRTGFLETEEEFAGLIPEVERPSVNAFDTAELTDGDGTVAVVPAAP